LPIDELGLSKLFFREHPGNVSALMQDAHDFDDTVVHAIEYRIGVDEDRPRLRFSGMLFVGLPNDALDVEFLSQTRVQLADANLDLGA
jgi:hypothetical protein